MLQPFKVGPLLALFGRFNSSHINKSVSFSEKPQYTIHANDPEWNLKQGFPVGLFHFNYILSKVYLKIICSWDKKDL